MFLDTKQCPEALLSTKQGPEAMLPILSQKLVKLAQNLLSRACLALWTKPRGRVSSPWTCLLVVQAAVRGLTFSCVAFRSYLDLCRDSKFPPLYVLWLSWGT